MIRRAPWWFPPISYVGLAAGVYLVSFFHMPPYKTALLPFAITGQAVLLLVMVRVLLKWPPFAAWLRAMPWVHRIVFGALMLGMFWGHYTINGRTYFPFVVWEIFPHAEGNINVVTAQQFYGETASGRQVRLLVEREFPSIIQIDRIETLDSAYGPGTTDQLAMALANRYNANHPGEPVHVVNLVEASVNLHPPIGESRNEPSWKLLKSYDVLPAPSR